METTPVMTAHAWKPTRSTSIWMTVLSTVLAIVAGAIAFVVAFGTGQGTIVFDVAGLAITLAIIAVSLVAHEGLHGLVMLAYGGRPTFGAGMAGKVLPYFYCTAPGQRFTVVQYVVVALAPTVVINAGLIAGLLTPIAGWFVLPFAVHIAGCIGDWFLTVQALRAPKGSLVEDMKDGLILHTPEPDRAA